MQIDDFLATELSELSKIYSNVDGLTKAILPSVEQVKTASMFTPYTDGSSFENYLNGIGEQFYNIWDSNVRTGYLAGLPSTQIVRNVMGQAPRNAQLGSVGAIQTLRNSLTANVRTALQSFATETRNEFYKKNEDIINGYKWCSALDRRTCLVCGSLDGKVYRNLSDIPKMMPLHFNCRCVLLPVIDEFEDVVDVRAAENGYVDDKITYDDWLGFQDEKTQKYILGDKRYEMYKQGVLLPEFIYNGKLIPLNWSLSGIEAEETYYQTNNFIKENVDKLKRSKIRDIFNKYTNNLESIDIYKQSLKTNILYYKSNLIQYKLNCQRAVIALEMRMRGLDVEARPCFLVEKDYIANNLHNVFTKKLNIHTDFIYGTSLSSFEEKILSKEDSRYFFTYKHKTGYHAIIVNKVGNKVKYYDPQMLKELTKKELSDNIILYQTFRVDNLEFNQIAEYAVKNKGEVYENIRRNT